RSYKLRAGISTHLCLETHRQDVYRAEMGWRKQKFGHESPGDGSSAFGLWILCRTRGHVLLTEYSRQSRRRTLTSTSSIMYKEPVARGVGQWRLSADASVNGQLFLHGQPRFSGHSCL